MNEPQRLSAKDVREIRAVVRDLKDKTRYVVASFIHRRLAFYYVATEGNWSMELDGATCFKRRHVAEAVRQALQDGGRNDRFRVIRLPGGRLPPELRSLDANRPRRLASRASAQKARLKELIKKTPRDAFDQQWDRLVPVGKEIVGSGTRKRAASKPR